MSNLLSNIPIEKKYHLWNSEVKDLEKYSKVIYDKVVPFIEKDMFEGNIQVYKVLEMNIHFSVVMEPYVYVWVRVIDKHLFYNGKIRFIIKRLKILLDYIPNS